MPAAYMQNVTAAIALRCRSDIESRQIVGVAGAENLPRYGKGILWDAEGIRTIDIPLTPEEDIINYLGWLRGPRLFWFALTHLRNLDAKYPPIDPVYQARMDKGLATW